MEAIYMEVTTWHEPAAVPVTVMQIKGDLTASEPLESQARAAFQDGARDIVLDLHQVNYISSAGLRVIHAVYMLLRGADPTDEETAARGIARGVYKSPHLKLVRPSKNGLKALTTAGYDMFLDIYDSVPAAVASFK
jgi:hypothetical protein